MIVGTEASARRKEVDIRCVASYFVFVKKDKRFKMSQVAFSIRMDEELKKDFGRFCEEIGMSMSTAFTVFAKEAVREGRIPFEVGTRGAPRSLRAFHALRAQALERFRNRPEPDLDEINALIAKTRRERAEQAVLA